MSEKTKCMYKAVRKPNTACETPATTDWGFCSKHSRTVQAKKAKDEYELLHPVVEDVQPVVEDEAAKQPVHPAEDPPQIVEKHVKQSLKQVSKKRAQPVKPRPTKTDIGSTTSSSTSKSTLSSEMGRLQTQVKSGRKSSTGAKSKTSVVDKGGKKVVRRTICRNFWGNYEDSETGIVFNHTEKCAIGVQHGSGRILPLGDVHIETCKRHGWAYAQPKRVTSVTAFSSSESDPDGEDVEEDLEEGEEEELEEGSEIEEEEEDEEELEGEEEEEEEEDEEELEEGSEIEEEDDLEEDEDEDLEEDEDEEDYGDESVDSDEEW